MKYKAEQFSIQPTPSTVILSAAKDLGKSLALFGQ